MKFLLPIPSPLRIDRATYSRDPVKNLDTVDVWAVLGSVNRRAGHIQRAVDMHKHVLELAVR